MLLFGKSWLVFGKSWLLFGKCPLLFRKIRADFLKRRKRPRKSWTRARAGLICERICGTPFGQEISIATFICGSSSASLFLLAKQEQAPQGSHFEDFSSQWRLCEAERAAASRLRCRPRGGGCLPGFMGQFIFHVRHRAGPQEPHSSRDFECVSLAAQGPRAAAAVHGQRLRSGARPNFCCRRTLPCCASQLMPSA